MFICRNIEGVHGQTKVGNPCPKLRYLVTIILDLKKLTRV